MLRLIRSRLTYANVAATIALVLAMSGSAIAANHYLITSTKQISPKVLASLKGAKGRNGAAGAPGAPGTSGSSGATGPSGSAGAKGERGEQGGSGEKGERGEQGPEGKVAGAATHWRTSIEKAGVSKAEATRVTLVESAPFKLVGHCYVEGLNTVAATYLQVTTGAALVAEPNEEGELVEAGEANEQPVVTAPATSSTSEHEAAFTGPGEGLFSAESTSGSAGIDGAANQGVFLEGKAKPACYFSGFLVQG
jgi:Collagen triple helix repeat (20 copies)